MIVLGRRAGLQLWIGGIDRPHAVDREVVVIDLGRDRTDRDGSRCRRRPFAKLPGPSRNSPVSITSSAFGAFRRNVTRPSGSTSGETSARRPAARAHDAHADATKTRTASASFHVVIRHTVRYTVNAVYFSSSRSTAMWRHFPWLNRSTLSTQRVAWPMRMAIQMSIGSSVAVRWMTKQMPSGTTICDTIEI